LAARKYLTVSGELSGSYSADDDEILTYLADCIVAKKFNFSCGMFRLTNVIKTV